MKNLVLIYGLLLFSLQGWTQDSTVQFRFKGQASAYANYNFDNYLNTLVGGNFIPSAELSIPITNKKQLIDFKVSANVYGSVLSHPFDTFISNGNLAPYRGWIRYSGKQFELRAGLQKINFGSAASLRPLRWFDQVDPRDPLQLTTGVYGLLGRYYFLNNVNIWGWALYGNEDPKGWEQARSFEQIPEYGGRIQFPIPKGKGEMGLSYHHRVADTRNLFWDSLRFAKVPENRIGIDGKWDVGIGLWFEASYTSKSRDIGQFTHQGLFNLGVDYTFGVGNGINVIGEHMLIAFDATPFAFEQPQHLSALTASYPLGLFDNLSTVVYYNWAGQNVLTFFNYQRDFKYLTSYIMVFVNPKNQGAIQQNELVQNLSGSGIQLMILYKF